MNKHCRLLAPIILLILAITQSCRKESFRETHIPHELSLLERSKSWYYSELRLASSSASPKTLDFKGYTPDWSKAKTVKNSKGKTVMGVPLFSSSKEYVELNVIAEYGEAVGIIKQYVLGKNQLNIYTEGGKLYTTVEYNTHKPEKEPLLMAEGNNKSFPQDEHIAYIYRPGSAYDRADPEYKRLPEVIVRRTRNMRRSAFPDPPIGSFDFPIGPIGEGSVSRGFFGDTRGGGPYGDESHRGGGGFGHIREEERNNRHKIVADPSITSNPIINCVYSNLMSSNLKHGLINILENFDGNETYNITFKVADIGGSYEGKMKYLGNNNFEILINKSLAESPGYSRIWLASTFMHEAFHAKLRQKALHLLGTDEIAKWPKKIDDADLNELSDYFQKSAKDKGVWNSIGHDWMVKHINEMTASLQEFVQTYYPQNYTKVNGEANPLNAYKALSYMGLQESVFFAEEASKIGSDMDMNKLRGLFVEGATGCSN